MTPPPRRLPVLATLLATGLAAGLALAACGAGGSKPAPSPGTPVAPPGPTGSAAPGGGTAAVQAPVLRRTLSDRWHEAWLASPAVPDLDGDGELEIVVALKGGVDRAPEALVYAVAGSAGNRLPRPTGRGNLLRNGSVP